MFNSLNQHCLYYEGRDIMEDIRQYILSVVCAGIACSAAIKFANYSKTSASVIKMLTGIFLAITVIAPLGRIQIDKLTDWYTDIDTNANSAVYDGEQFAIQSTVAIIKQETQAYILDKASLLEMDISVDVSVSETSPFVPVSVAIVGESSPYAKKTLESIIANDLGIPKEKQVWR